MLSELARSVSHRRTSIGSDGLLAVRRLEDGIGLRMFNPDGTEDFCGNGLRIAARYAELRNWCANEFQIQHLDRVVQAEVNGDGLASTTTDPASFDPVDVPVTSDRELIGAPIVVQGSEIEISAVSTGSTHSVIFVPELPGDDKFSSISSMLEHSPLFPNRTSVVWAVRTSEKALSIRIWERGAGETLGCGTGSAAAAVVLARQHRLSGDFLIQNPGGQVIVALKSWDSPIVSRSVPTFPFEGRIQLGEPPDHM